MGLKLSTAKRNINYIDDPESDTEPEPEIKTQSAPPQRGNSTSQPIERLSNQPTQQDNETQQPQQDTQTGPELTTVGDSNRNGHNNRPQPDIIKISIAPSCGLKPIQILTNSAYTKGKIHEQFTKIKLIGEGAVAKVYLYQDDKTGKKVAVKKFHRKRLMGQRMYSNTSGSSSLGSKLKVSSLWDKALHEIEVLTYLHSLKSDKIVNICQVYAIINDPKLEYLFFIMEYGENGIFSTVDDTGYQFSKKSLKNEEFGIKIYKQIITSLQGLQYAGIIHNDIKPANIIITQDGIPKLIDFGEAIIIGQKYPELLNHFITLDTKTFQNDQKSLNAQNTQGIQNTQDVQDAQSVLSSANDNQTANTNIQPDTAIKQAQPPDITPDTKLSSLDSPIQPLESVVNTTPVLSPIVQTVLDIDGLLSDSEPCNDDEGSYELAGLDNNGIFGTIPLETVDPNENPTTQPLQTSHDTTPDVPFTPETFNESSWYQLGMIKQGPGTPFFGSPETCMGPYNGFDNDLWALGVCLFSSVLGFLPFFSLQNNPQATTYASLELIQTGKVSWKSPFNPPIDPSPQFKAFLEQILSLHNRPKLYQCKDLPFG